MVKIANFGKQFNWKMPETPSKMHKHAMVKIDTIIFEIVAPPPSPRIVSCLKYILRSDRVKELEDIGLYIYIYIYIYYRSELLYNILRGSYVTKKKKK